MKYNRRINWCIISILLMVSLTGVLYWVIKKDDGQNTVSQQDPSQIVLHWMVQGEKYQETDTVLKEFNKKLAEKFPGVSIDIEFVSANDYKKTWETKMTINEKLDLAWISNECIDFADEVKKGSFMALDYLLVSDGKTIYDNIAKEDWRNETYDGHIYGIPVSGIQYQNVVSVMANEYYMERYGNLEAITEVNTSKLYSDRAAFDVFDSYLENIYKAGDIGTGVSCMTFQKLADKGYEGIYGWNSPFVIKMFDNYPTVYNRYSLESYEAYFSKMSEWYQKGYIRPDINSILNPTDDDGREGGSILYLVDDNTDVIGVHENKDQYTAVKRPLQNYRYRTFDSNKNTIVIPKSADNPVMAMKVLDYLFSGDGQEAYRLLVNGIEREHYLILEDDTIVHRRDNGNNLLYYISPNMIGNIFNDYENMENEFNNIASMNEEAIKSPLMGFELDTRMIANEIEIVNLVVDEYKDSLCQGYLSNWQQTYEEFQLAMEKAGSEKIINEMQRQIDLFINKEKVDQKQE